MTWCHGLESIVKRDAPPQPLTWMRVGGPARWLVQPRSAEQLAEVLRRTHQQAVDVRLLGLGANLLVSDSGVEAAVIRLSDESFQRVEFD